MNVYREQYNDSPARITELFNEPKPVKPVNMKMIGGAPIKDDPKLEKFKEIIRNKIKNL